LILTLVEVNLSYFEGLCFARLILVCVLYYLSLWLWTPKLTNHFKAILLWNNQKCPQIYS